MNGPKRRRLGAYPTQYERRKRGVNFLCLVRHDNGCIILRMVHLTNENHGPLLASGSIRMLRASCWDCNEACATNDEKLRRITRHNGIQLSVNGKCAQIQLDGALQANLDQPEKLLNATRIREFLFAQVPEHQIIIRQMNLLVVQSVMRSIETHVALLLNELKESQPQAGPIASGMKDLTTVMQVAYTHEMTIWQLYGESPGTLQGFVEFAPFESILQKIFVLIKSVAAEGQSTIWESFCASAAHFFCHYARGVPSHAVQDVAMGAFGLLTKGNKPQFVRNLLWGIYIMLRSETRRLDAPGCMDPGALEKRRGLSPSALGRMIAGIFSVYEVENSTELSLQEICRPQVEPFSNKIESPPLFANCLLFEIVQHLRGAGLKEVLSDASIRGAFVRWWSRQQAPLEEDALKMALATLALLCKMAEDSDPHGLLPEFASACTDLVRGIMAVLHITSWGEIRQQATQWAYYDVERHEIAARLDQTPWAWQLRESHDPRRFVVHSISRFDILSMLRTFTGTSEAFQL